MRKTMLVADDHSDMRDYVRMALDVERHRTYEAENGEDALLMAQNLRPDCVFLDIKMPGELDGLDVCHLIKSDDRLKDTRVVIITGNATADVALAAERAGADACLVKPFTFDSLLSTLKDIGHSRTQHACS